MMPNYSKIDNRLHHLYEIVDKEDDDVFKYGISCESLGTDGLSSRMRKQIALLNRLFEWPRFFGRIIKYDIPSKKIARTLETKCIREYEHKYGRKPKGNVRY